jgi:hypothetical protein
VAAASEARRSSSLSTSGKRVSFEAETAYDPRPFSDLSTSGKRVSLEAETAYEAHRSGSLSASGKRISLEAETAYDSPTLLPLQREQTDDSSRYCNNNQGGFYS